MSVGRGGGQTGQWVNPRRSAGQRAPAFSRRRGQTRRRAAGFAHRAPFAARRAATGSWCSPAPSHGGGLAGEWPELRRRRGQAEAEARPARARGCGGLVGVALAPTASTRCGERVDAMPGTKWSPEHHRRRVRAAACCRVREARRLRHAREKT